MNNNTKTFVAKTLLVVSAIFIVACVLALITSSGTQTSKSYNRSHYTSNKYDSDSLDTEYTNYKMRSTGNDVQVTTHDNITGKNHTYNINVGNTPPVPKLSAQQKKYLSQNKELVLLASKVYGFVALNDYRLVKFCSQYYPVTKFKQKYDNRFREKRIKAEKILENAYGSEGSATLKKTIMSNSDALRVVYQQVEDDYQLIRGLAAQDGISNFSRKDYCKMFEDSPDEAVEQQYQKFKLMAPNF